MCSFHYVSDISGDIILWNLINGYQQRKLGKLFEDGKENRNMITWSFASETHQSSILELSLVGTELEDGQKHLKQRNVITADALCLTLIRVRKRTKIKPNELAIPRCRSKSFVFRCRFSSLFDVLLLFNSALTLTRLQTTKLLH